MGQGIDRRGNDKFSRLGGQQLRIDDRYVGDQGAADNRHLHLALHVGNDGELGDIRSTSGRRGNKHHRRQRPLNAIGTFIVLHFPAVARHHGNAFGTIHGASAPDGHDHIAIAFLVEQSPVLNLMVTGVRADFVEIGPLKMLVFQDGEDPINPSCPLKARIAHQEDPFRSQALGTKGRVLQTSLTEKDLGDGKFPNFHGLALLTFWALRRVCQAAWHAITGCILK